MVTKYIFDGSYAGYLTCLFTGFEYREFDAVPVDEKDYPETLFDDCRKIETDREKAARVYRGLVNCLGRDRASYFYRGFLSEDNRAWRSGLKLMQRVFRSGAGSLQNFGDDDVLYFFQTLKKVRREAHRMTAFVRFSKSTNGLFFSVIEPDFNVLPLVKRFFKDRYADQHWLIYDAKRKYGLLYDKVSVHEVRIVSPEQPGHDRASISIALDERDELFKRLWQLYFKTASITARKNPKLHLQHVPKRYWKHLVEKQ